MASQVITESDFRYSLLLCSSNTHKLFSRGVVSNNCVLVISSECLKIYQKFAKGQGCIMLKIVLIVVI